MLTCLPAPLRPPNQNLFVGSTLRSEPHFTSIEGVIPNSQVVISPPAAPDSPGLSTSWKWQLYLHPADYVPWVSVFVVLTTLALGGAVALLHRREQVRPESPCPSACELRADA